MGPIGVVPGEAGKTPAAAAGSLKSPLRAAAPPAASRQPPAPAPPGPAPPPEAEGGRLRADRSARRRRRQPFRPAPGLGPHLPRTPLAPGSPAARLPTRHRPRPRPRAHGAARAPPTAQSPDGAPPTPHRHAHPRGLPGRPAGPRLSRSDPAQARAPAPPAGRPAGRPCLTARRRGSPKRLPPRPPGAPQPVPAPAQEAGPAPGPACRPRARLSPVPGPRPPTHTLTPHASPPPPPRSSDPGPWAAAAGPRVQTSCSRPRAPGSALGRRGPPPGATPTRRAGVAPHAARPSGHTAAPCAAAAALPRSVGHEPPVGCGRPRWLQTLTQEPGGERQRLLTAEVAQLPQVRLAGGEGDTAARSARPSTRRLGACRPPAGGTLATRAARPVGDISLGRPLPSVLRLARPGLGTPARRQ
ncbi:uncharacterized protein [Dasypus novemcinctus]|uniref:uncharacterized protein n=1 Tax=Dasypus novemcinctus TaxID=9361 RepID=UPI0039C8CF31